VVLEFNSRAPLLREPVFVLIELAKNLRDELEDILSEYVLTKNTLTPVSQRERVPSWATVGKAQVGAEQEHNIRRRRQ